MTDEPPTTAAALGAVGGELARPDLAPLVEEARRNAEASKAPGTLRAYASDWRSFGAWCAEHGLAAMPASPQALALHISAMAAGGAAVASVRRRMAAVAEAHRLRGHPSPADDAHVRAVFKGLRRRHGRPQRAKPAILPEALARLCRAAPPGAAGLAGLRDRAILLLGFAGAFRRSELVALEVADLDWREEALRVTVRRAKGDQEGRGAVKFIFPSRSSPDTCPVRTLREWLARAGVSAGPVFRRVDRHGNVGDRAMAGASVALILKRAGGAAGMDRGALGAHGLRSGFATSMSRAGVDLRRIMNQTGHRSVAVAMRYVQEGERLRDDFTELARL